MSDRSAAEALSADRIVESIAFMGTIDIRLQVCAWCGSHYGEPHRDPCPVRVQEPVLRAALDRERAAALPEPESYVRGHWDGLNCEANGFGGRLSECEHVGHIYEPKGASGA